MHTLWGGHIRLLRISATYSELNSTKFDTGSLLEKLYTSFVPYSYSVTYLRTSRIYLHRFSRKRLIV